MSKAAKPRIGTASKPKPAAKAKAGTSAKGKPKAGAKAPRSALRRFGRKVLLVFLILFGSSVLYLTACKWIYPPITVTQLVSWAGGHGFRRSFASWEYISPQLKLAAIASEDQLFAEHWGFDFHAIKKSIDQKGRKRKKRERGAAASTISQQTAKNVFLWQGRGWSRYVRKPIEAVYTVLIELIWGKKRILEVYLNEIETGPGLFGVEAASMEYFHKPAKALSRQEAAMLIACLPNPKKFTVNPVSKRVLSRYPRIMNQMENIEGDEDVEALIGK